MAKDILKQSGELARKARESGLDKVADALISATPIGGYWNIAKKIGQALGLGDGASESAIADALESATPEQRAQIAEIALREQEAILADYQHDREQATARHAADMMGDCRLSKTWRPIVGYIVIASFLVDWILCLILLASGKPSQPNELLATLATTVVGFYYGSRGLQHIASKFASKWSGKVR
jgi:hypothetical protein